MTIRLALMMSLLSGCLGLDSSTDENLSSTGENPLGTFDEFKANTYRQPWDGGAYIVEIDIVLPDDAALFRYWSSHGQGALVVGNTGSDIKWNNTEKLNLTYCVDGSFGANTVAVNDALSTAGWEWERRGTIKFIHVTSQDGAGCTASNNNVLFNVRKVFSGPSASAFFPDYTRMHRELLVNNGTLGNSPRNLVAVMGHEFGHILGFRHEFVRPEDTTSCGVPNADGYEENDTNWRQLTVYDPNSVMTYPGCGADWWTNLDRDGVSALYGAAPSRAPESDILWRCAPSSPAASCGSAPAGSIALWNNGESAETVYLNLTALSNDWKIVGVGDFDGSGRRDILWRNTATGDNVIWPNGTNAGYYITSLATGWNVAGIGDFNGNGKSDILWRDGSGNNVIWTDTVSPGFWTTAAATNWQVAGIGDFDGNGRSDILWRDNGGNNSIWPNGMGPGYWPASLSTSWSVSGIGDFNADGRSDILWRSNTGDNAIWPSAVSPGTWLTFLDTGWKVAGVGDFDLNGKSDILWRRATGDNAVWHDGSAAWTSWFSPLDPSWKSSGVGRFLP